MPYWVYVIENDVTGKLYKGQISDLAKRLERHNLDEPGSRRYTYRQKGKWHLIHSKEYYSRSEALKRERFLKSGQGREWIKSNLLGRRANRQSPPEMD